MADFSTISFFIFLFSFVIRSQNPLAEVAKGVDILIYFTEFSYSWEENTTEIYEN